MTYLERRLLTGLSVAALCALAIGIAWPGMVAKAFGDESVAGTIDVSRLVRFEGVAHEVSAEPWVDTVPASTSIVKKIEGGKVSYVTIVRTSTGTYSSDAMASRHVEYPGIVVERVDRRGYGFSRIADFAKDLGSILDLFRP